MIEKIVFIALFTALFLLLAYVNKRFDLGLNSDGEMSRDDKRRSAANEAPALRKRIEVLERIVTEPSYSSLHR